MYLKKDNLELELLRLPGHSFKTGQQLKYVA